MSSHIRDQPGELLPSIHFLSKPGGFHTSSDRLTLLVSTEEAVCKSSHLRSQPDKGSLSTPHHLANDQEGSVFRLSQYLAHLLQQAYPEQEKLSLDVPSH